MTEHVATWGSARPEEDVRETVRALVLELAQAPDARTEPGTRLVEDLGFHSLALLELAFGLEDEFDLPPIDEETARGIATVGDIEAHVLGVLRDRG
ncbi:acyl carrier protein [Actinosynnema sp. NPDC020468]|uniref:acyl carrier protein n=1 Tax=Actinosynnema sp. NPDC020468 TaxID=3154488 RepID=UPI003403D2A9